MFDMTKNRDLVASWAKRQLSEFLVQTYLNCVRQIVHLKTTVEKACIFSVVSPKSYLVSHEQCSSRLLVTIHECPICAKRGSD